MKIRTKVRAGGVNLNRNAKPKKVAVKRPRAGVAVQTAVKAAQGLGIFK